MFKNAVALELPIWQYSRAVQGEEFEIEGKGYLYLKADNRASAIFRVVLPHNGDITPEIVFFEQSFETLPVYSQASLCIQLAERLTREFDTLHGLKLWQLVQDTRFFQPPTTITFPQLRARLKPYRYTMIGG